MRQIVIAFVCFLSLSASVAHAVDRIHISVGSLSRPSYHVDTISSYRAGLSWDTELLNDYLSDQSSIRLESSIGLNQTSLGDVYDITAAPVFHYQFKKFDQKAFFEISAGIAYLSDTDWAAYHDMGSNLQFADRIGFGYAFEKSEISINFFHFSNGGTNAHNPGCDMLLLRTSFKI
ncbi:lipid A deacylase PagL [Cellvibrio zantedeschiae]|uniref:Lipid A deacylase PagL n=1 Tax=Cellvibrio zantedeschiae TaxID=1237077 RepID=A0ABQ3AZY5_9GAMM|nr:acyloxyacyl hydrolase [Cellvibrio zantedeschiae]GGY73081.1 lipid A deacylase PagL [Cellvibrio zantedeschiae]